MMLTEADVLEQINLLELEAEKLTIQIFGMGMSHLHPERDRVFRTIDSLWAHELITPV